MDNTRYVIGRNGAFATLYDRQTNRLLVDNATESHCRRVRDRLIAQAHDLDPLDAAFAALAPGLPERAAA